jgi:Replication-relaxation
LFGRLALVAVLCALGFGFLLAGLSAISNSVGPVADSVGDRLSQAPKASRATPESPAGVPSGPSSQAAPESSPHKGRSSSPTGLDPSAVDGSESGNTGRSPARQRAQATQADGAQAQADGTQAQTAQSAPAESGEGVSSNDLVEPNWDPFAAAFAKPMSMLGVALRIVGVILFGILGIALWTRWCDRRRRRYTVFQLKSYRDEGVSLEQLRSLISSWSNLMFVRSRRFQRFFWGAPTLTLRVFATPEPLRSGGDSEIEASSKEHSPTEVMWLIQMPSDPSLEKAFSEGFVDAYKDTRLVRISRDHRWSREITRLSREVVRLKKVRRIPFTLLAAGTRNAGDTLVEGFQAPLSDRLAATLSAYREPVELQLAMTVVPRPFDRLIHALSRKHGSSSSASSSPITAAEGQNIAKASASETHFFVDMRIAAQHYEVARDVAASFSGAAGGDTQLRERRPVLRRSIYRGRFRDGTSNPIPSWLHSVYSVSEISLLWQMPSRDLKGVAIERTNMPRIPAPPEVWRPKDPDLAVLYDVVGTPLAPKYGDLPMNIGISGNQGMGKTALEAAVVSLVARNPNFAMFLLDPKGDLAEAALSAIPGNRKVHYIDFHAPECGIDPFLVSGGKDFDAIVDVINQGMIDVSRTEDDESQILASSLDLLTNANLATLATTVPFGIRPTLHHFGQWLSTSDGAIEWREALIEKVLKRRPDMHAVTTAYLELHSNLRKATSAFVQRTSAPYNKVRRLTRSNIDKVLRHPNALDIGQIIRDREILIVNGQQMGDRYTVMRFLVQMISHELGNQQALPESERVPVFLGVDEVPPLLTPYTADMIAQRRSAGLSFMAAYQHDAQIENERVLETMTSLLQIWFQLRCGITDARTRANLFQPSYGDRYENRLGQLRTYRFGPAALSNLPRFGVAAKMVVDGEPVNAAGGYTKRMEIDPAQIEEHLSRQRESGGYVPQTLRAPDLAGQQKTVIAQAAVKTFVEPAEDADLYIWQREGAGNGSGNGNGDGHGNGDGSHGDGEAAHLLSAPEATTPPPPVTSSSQPPAVTPRAAPQPPVPPPPPAPPVSTPVPEPPSPAPIDRVGLPGEAVEESPLFDRDRVSEETAPPPQAEEPPTALDAVLPDANERDFDAAVLAAQVAGGDPQETAREVRRRQSVVGPLGKPMRVPTSQLLEDLDDFEDVDDTQKAQRLEKPDAVPRSRGARDARAKLLASGSELKEENVLALRWIYEFNYMTSQQLAVVMNTSLSTISRRTKQLLDNGLVRGLTFRRHGGRKRVWHLTDFGYRVGHHFHTRRGSVLPADPGWRERSADAALGITHDLHVGAYVLQLAALIDGPGDPLVSSAGLITEIKGSRGAAIDPPKEQDGRKRVPLTPQLLAGLEPSLVIDSPVELDGFRSLTPDAAIFLRDLRGGDDRARSQVLIDYDRSGHRQKLVGKLRRYDAFYAAWGSRHSQARHGLPATLFVAADESLLRRHLAIADQVLCTRRGSSRTPASEWPAPPSRRRIFFALERDLHQGTLRCYRLPEQPPLIREAGARNENEREAALRFTPESLDLLPPRLLFERRAQ